MGSVLCVEFWFPERHNRLQFKQEKYKHEKRNTKQIYPFTPRTRFTRKIIWLGFEWWFSELVTNLSYVSCIMQTSAVERRRSIYILIPEEKDLRYISLFFPSHLFLRLRSLLLPSGKSYPGSQSGLFSPLPHNCTCLAFLSRKSSNTFPRRFASTCAFRRYV